jgi:hypothetical protein
MSDATLGSVSGKAKNHGLGSWNQSQQASHQLNCGRPLMKAQTLERTIGRKRFPCLQDLVHTFTPPFTMAVWTRPFYKMIPAGISTAPVDLNFEKLENYSLG